MKRMRVHGPNRLKPGDLDFKSPGLAVSVPIAGAKTVGDLIKAPCTATSLDLYAYGFRFNRIDRSESPDCAAILFA